jgi:hypothetical protein
MYMPKPVKAFLAKELLPQGRAGLPSSGHEVTKVTFASSTGIEAIGFFKPCDDETYPPLLAKYAVAVGQLYRMTLGQRAAEDRLVYNDDGQIIGTVSIGIKNFLPMCASSDKAPRDREKASLAIPSKQTLIDNRIAEVLIASWRHKEDDLHPGNLSLEGRIDWDMSKYHLTSIIKGERFVCGLLVDNPHNSTKLLGEDLDNFPIIKSQRTHWPTRTPGNLNFNKAYQSQSAFMQLANSNAFKKQVYFALLKEILSFQPLTLQERLHRYLGDEALDLDSLLKASGEADVESSGSIKNELLKNFNRNLFYNKDEERSFVDHFLLFENQEYNEFKRVVIHYPGFRNYLVENPQAFLEAKEWFDEQNHLHPYIPYQLDEIEIIYQKVWRQSALKKTVSKVFAVKDIIEEIDNHIELWDVTSSYVAIKTNPSSGHTVHDIPGMIRRPSVDGLVKPQDPQSQTLVQSRDSLQSVFNRLCDLTAKYFQNKKTKATASTNRLYINQCKELLTELGSITQDLQGLATTKGHLKSWRDEFNAVLEEIDYDIHVALREHGVSSKAIAIGYSAPSISPSLAKQTKTILTPDDASVIRNAFAVWLQSQSREELDPEIRKALKDYKGVGADSYFCFLNPLNYTKTRAPKIEVLLTKNNPKPNTNEIMVEILSKGGWNETSFNNILLTRLLKKMIASYSTNIEYSSRFPLLIRLQRGILRDQCNLDSYFEPIAENLIQDLAEKSTPSRESHEAAILSP